MNAEELEIARRLVACPKWVWLPGMLTIRDDAQPLRLEFVDEPGWGMTQTVENNRHVFSLASRLPDLDDDLTRLGVLALVRRAWGQDDLAARRDGSGTWAVIPENSEWWSGCRDSELEALTHALEAAP